MLRSTENSIEALVRQLNAVIDRALAERRVVGTFVLVLEDGEFVYRRAAGFADREAGTAMREDGIFLLSSLTKPIVAATTMALVERGKLSLDDAVTKWIPEFQPAMAEGTKPEITIRQLLSHTAGLGYGLVEPEDGPYHRANVSDGLDQPGLSIEENLRRIASIPLSYKPGTSWGYSVASDVLGEVISRASGTPLPEAVSRFVTTPLGMRHTSFSFSDPSGLVVPYTDGSPQPVRMKETQVVLSSYGAVRFAPSRIFNPQSFASGGCGMAGTGDDFAKFLEALRTGGHPILSAQSVKAMTTDQSGGPRPQPGVAFGYGMAVVTDPTAAQTPQSAGTFTWAGVYGHTWFVDPAKQLTVVALTNTTLEGIFGQFPIQVRDAVYSAENAAQSPAA
jgi:CubicO group peptidase (beta-lactamase class C family)